jgi:thiamine kinase-like enzyme
MSKSDNSDLLLIDLEYAGWNPMAMDLAVYMNETMIDNSHSEDNGVKVYKGNHMNDKE